MNLSLKHKLMLQSLSPLAFLTIVRNFKFTPVSELAENQSYWGEFVRLNNVLIVVFLLCATWILAAIISFISFTAFRWTDKKQGYQLSSFVEKEDASLNFFMTMIIPLLIDDVGTIQGAVTFLIIVVMMCALLSKTHLYYANPVLAILGYRVYEITFKSNPDFNNEICLAVVKGRFLKNPSDIVQIDSRADVIIFSSSVVTAKMDLMQRFFGFEQYIRAGAQKTIEIIRDLDIVDSLEKFVAFENKSKLTNAKKLLKAKNSPVLQMKKNDLLENLKKHSRYKTMFKFEEDHIVISSQKEAAAFIKMLNDDIVRSELTGKEYDSSSKMLLGPMGSSQ